MMATNKVLPFHSSTATCSLLLCLLTVSYVDAASPPNIILILADQLRYDAVGEAHSITPNLDALRSEGAWFRNAFSSTPTCTPARAALLTGCSPWNHGLLGYGRMAKKYPTELPRLLTEEAGYHSVVIGKNHYGVNVTMGFEQQSLYEGLPEIFDDYDAWFQTLKPGQDPMASGLGWNDWRGCSYVYDEYYHPTSWVGRHAVNFLNQYESSGKPFFLKVSFHRPHSPYDPPQRFLDMIDPSKLPPVRVGAAWDEEYRNSSSCGGDDAWCGEFPANATKYSRASYLANVVMVDEWIGKVVTEMKKRQPNTFVIFTTDHGDMQGDHYLWRKGYPYQGSAHIPFLMTWPNSMSFSVARGSTLDHVVELRDVMPTLLEVANATKQRSECGGKSLLPLLRDPRSCPWRSYVDLEHDIVYNVTIHWNALTDGRYKYIYRAYYGDEQLFNLENDPYEFTNLAPSPQYTAVLEEWRNRLVRQFQLEGRGREWVVNGTLQQRQKSQLYSPHYPGSNHQVPRGSWKTLPIGQDEESSLMTYT